MSNGLDVGVGQVLCNGFFILFFKRDRRGNMFMSQMYRVAG